jgi:hypothetical protein
MTTETRPQYETVADVKRANHDAGQHWFDRDTMRFFASRVGSRLYHNRFFVSSEQFRSFTGADGDRAYTIREAMPDGSIEEVGAFQQFETMGAAVAGIRDFMRSEAVRISSIDPDTGRWRECSACTHLADFQLATGANICNDHLFEAIR